MKQIMGVRADVLAVVLMVCALLSYIIPSHAYASVGINTQIPFTGTLKDSAGATISGTYDMVFTIYDTASGGTVLWVGTYTVGNGNPVTVTSGTFQTMLGSGAGNALTLDFNDDAYYLGVKIGTDPEMVPRERLGASGYAINADTVDGLHASSFLQSESPIEIVTTTPRTLITLDQQGTGDLLHFSSGGMDVLTVLNNGSLNVQSPDISYFNGNIQLLQGSGIRLGSLEEEGGGGLSLSVDDSDPSGPFGPNVLIIGQYGSAQSNNSADITTSGSLSLNANLMNGPSLSLAETGDVTISVGNVISDIFNVNGNIRSSELTGIGDEMLYVDSLGTIKRGPMLSDIRLKQNVQTIDNALEKVLGLRGVSYEWKNVEKYGTQTEVGFIAQEIQTVLPEVVRPSGDFLGVKIQNVVAVVVEAIKELNAKMEGYFARTENLEKEVADLRAEIETLKQVKDSQSVQEKDSDTETASINTPEVIDTGTVTVPIEDTVVTPVDSTPVTE
jgi:hypothetical protein